MIFNSVDHYLGFQSHMIKKLLFLVLTTVILITSVYFHSFNKGLFSDILSENQIKQTILELKNDQTLSHIYTHNKSTFLGRIKEAQLKSRNKDYRAAIAIYEEILKNYQEDFRVWNEYGWNLAKINKYQESGKAYGQSINISNHAESWRLLGLNYETQGDYKKAKTCYNTSLDINPANNSAASSYHHLINRLEENWSEGSTYKANRNSRVPYRHRPKIDSEKKGYIKPERQIFIIRKVYEDSEKKTFWGLISHEMSYGYVFSGDLIRQKRKQYF